ncbi:MAG: nucleotidyltransferase [Bacteroidota bacterium]|nr:nucleotidyltransferase [Bacteroidota bacterium]
MFYQEVFESLNKNKVRYLVVGGVAVNLHGIPRMTYDLDLMIALDKENIHKTWVTLNDIGFVPRVPIVENDLLNQTRRLELKEKENMLVISFFRGSREFNVVDFFIDNPIDFDSCYQHMKKIKIDLIDVPLINIRDLIALKKLSNRKQDIDDINSLTSLLENYHE